MTEDEYMTTKNLAYLEAMSDLHSRILPGDRYGISEALHLAFGVGIESAIIIARGPGGQFEDEVEGLNAAKE